MHAHSPLNLSLLAAARLGLPHLFEAALGAGADPAARDESGSDALRLLRDAPAFAEGSPGPSLLAEAVDRRHPLLTRLLVDSGVAEPLAHGRSSALTAAVLQGRADLARALLPLSSARALDQHGRTVLMRACERADVACVDAVLPDSDARAIDVWGRSALDYARMGRCPLCVARVQAKLLADSERSGIDAALAEAPASDRAAL